VADIGSLVQRAEPFGLILSAAHIVAVAETDQPMPSAGRITGWVEDAVRARFGRGALVAAKDGRLACVLAGAKAGGPPDGDDLGGALSEIVGPAVAELTQGEAWRIGVGRPHAGPRGVFRSYRDALEALDVANRLGRADPVARAQDLLVYRVLLRDEAALAELVRAVLTPLLKARGGPGPLLETLEAYLTSGGNSAEAARKLHLSVRTVTYRLKRVQKLTGYAVSDPAQRLPVEVAVMGARLLDWPRREQTGD
jgi:sugar diacid utilization regulator